MWDNLHNVTNPLHVDYQEEEVILLDNKIMYEEDIVSNMGMIHST